MSTGKETWSSVAIYLEKALASHSSTLLPVRLFIRSENMAVCFLQRKGKGKRDPKMETIVFFNLSS